MAVANAPHAVATEHLTIHVEEGEAGWFVARIEEIPEAISQGRTPEEARRQVLSALHDLVYEPTWPERAIYRLRRWRANVRDLLPAR
jgi:hypothetical protein